MSLGDDVLTLSRALRELKKAGETPATEESLRTKTGFDAARFQIALNEAIECEVAERNAEGKIDEGKNQKNEVEESVAKNLPILRFAPDKQPTWERVWLALLATGLVIFVGYLITQKSTFSPQTWKLATVLASILAAAVGAFLTGMLEVKHERPGLAVRATGALGAFVLVLVVLLLP